MMNVFVDEVTQEVTVFVEGADDPDVAVFVEESRGSGTPGPAGEDGDDGREVELQKSATHVQWRYVGEVSWTNLVALSEITGPAGADGADSTVPGPAGNDGADGREVELQKSATHVQWRYVGEVSWTNLVALSEITGPAGADGADSTVPGPAGDDGTDGREVEFQKSATHVQWRYVGDVSWTNLVALSEITGPAGADGADSTVPGPAGDDGADGREVEFQKSATHVQWRYVGEVSWTNLVALSEITGPAGADGADGGSLPKWKATTATPGSTTTTIPQDDTIPQSTEGAEILTITITPTSTEHFLRFTLSGWVSCSASATVPVAAFFKDSDANASCVIVTTRLAAGNVIVGFSGHVIVPVTSTASQTWKLRMGTASGTFYWLQNNAGGLFSTADCLVWEIEEVAYES